MNFPNDFVGQIILGNCLDVMKLIPDNSIDAIITDPPYPREFSYLYGGIACEAKRILKRGGSLVAIVPHYLMPEAMRDVGQYLKYRWICSMWQERGKHPRMAMGIEIMWKPIVWWVKEAWPMGRGFVKDGFDNDPPDKKLYEWEQSESWSDYCMKFTKPGDLVLDPLIGAGTTAVSCIRHGRNFIGIEMDESRYYIAKNRIANLISS